MHINDIPSHFHLPSLLWDFMSRVSNEATANGCRLWQGVTARNYGRFSLRGEDHAAHRLSYVLFNGAIPEDLHVLHRCDVPLCVNPAHLFLGTEADNHADKAAKGRAARGVANGSAKISEETVLAIFSATGTHRGIAAAYKVSQATVCHIKSGRQWSSVTGKIFIPSYRVRGFSPVPSDVQNS